MIKIELVNKESYVAHLSGLSSRLRAEIKKTIQGLGNDLKSHIQADKLSGQVLHVRTGRLRSSIKEQTTDDGNSITSTISTNVEYAAIHEYGGRVRTRLGTGKGPPKKNGKAFIEMPERSFMRSGLVDFRDRIRSDLEDAVARAK